MKILVTGGAGFIGSALAKRLYEEGNEVVVVDNFNSYYNTTLKRDRVRALIPSVPLYMFDIVDKDALSALFKHYQFDVVCHLAAQAGVRYSVEAPEVYVHTNVLGTQTLYECMRTYGVKRMVFASTSSVYGTSTQAPFSESSPADKPVSVYAATKRAGELIAHNYFSQYGIETTCLRFFTVYGPWSRPDMAMLSFADNIMNGRPIELFNNGNLRRDFTYIDDIVAGFVKAVYTPLGYEIINLGNGTPIELLHFVQLLEQSLKRTAEKVFLPMQRGDVFETFADTQKAKTVLGFSAKVGFEEGVAEFAKWYFSQKPQTESLG
jgi:UDP-glucuronate 4-epimerase